MGALGPEKSQSLPGAVQVRMDANSRGKTAPANLINIDCFDMHLVDLNIGTKVHQSYIWYAERIYK